jgi:hypothetical protein
VCGPEVLEVVAASVLQFDDVVNRVCGGASADGTGGVVAEDVLAVA